MGVSNFRPRIDTVLQVGQDKARVGDELSHEGPTRAVSKTWGTRPGYGSSWVTCRARDIYEPYLAKGNKAFDTSRSLPYFCLMPAYTYQRRCIHVLVVAGPEARFVPPPV